VTGRLEREVAEALVDALRPIVRELVAEELQRHRLDVDHDHDAEPAPYLTVAEYAERHRSTPAAVRARIRRRSLHAIRPPGSREYLIPNEERPGGHDGHPEGHATIGDPEGAPATRKRPGA
jgi:hypothetical protein